MRQKRVDSDAEMIRGILRDDVALNVRPIPPSSEHKSPDLLIDVPGARILVEVERKTRDQQLRQLVDGERGAILRYSGARTEERIEKAWRQIRDYPPRKPSDSTLIWLIAGQKDTTILTATAAITRLYGVEKLEGYTEAGDYYSKSCYFFYESLFFKYKDLDAVAVQSYDKASLCLNPYSPRFQLWRRYPFLSSFSVVDPVAEESTGAVFFADCDEDRNDTNRVVRYLRQKYQLRAPTITQYVLVNSPVDP